MAEVIVNNLVKTYNKGEIKAVNELSFEVKQGELFGLIGPDGAGKTSLFRMLATLLLPDSGTATVKGCDTVKDYKQIRRMIGYMPGKFSLYPDLSVEENLSFFATIFKTSVKENYDLIRDIYVQLAPFKDRRAGKLSGGMKQKLALCCALIHRPSVLFLDEPTTGVDVVSRKEFWEMLQNLKAQGISILVSTPYMDEATLCERIALMQKGTIMTIDTPDNIVQQYPDRLFAIKADNMSGLLNVLRNHRQIKSCYSFGEFHHITFRHSEVAPTSHEKLHSQTEALTQDLLNAHFSNIELKPVTPGIEDCFINSSYEKESRYKNR